MAGESTQRLSDKERAVLQAFSRALRRESHVLTRYPYLLWQQIYNRLQWEGDEVRKTLTSELELRSMAGAVPWARTLTPYRESQAIERLLIGHRKGVSGCAVSPDGAWIVSASSDRTLKVWDAVSYQELHTLEGHQGAVYACAISPDGAWIVSASSDKTLRVWDAASGKELRTLKGHGGSVLACNVSPDGTRIVSASQDGKLKIWDTTSGLELRTLVGHSDGVNGCAFSPDGTSIVSASDDGTLIVWDASTGEQRLILTGHNGPVTSCAVSPDGIWILSGSTFVLKVWNASQGAEVRTLRGHRDVVDGCAFSPDGLWIVSASLDTTLKIWESASGTELHTLAGHSDSVYSCAASVDGTHVISTSADKALRVWDLAVAKVGHTLSAGHKYWVNGCAFSPDGTRAISTSADHSMKIWDTTSGTEVGSLTVHGSQLYGCVFSSDDAWIVAGGDNQVFIWEAEGNLKRTFSTNHSPGILFGELDCALSTDHSWMVSASSDKTLYLWDIASGRILRRLVSHRDSVLACALSPNESWIVSASADKTIKLWDVLTGELRRTLTGHHAAVTDCAVNLDGSKIVSASDDSTLKVWDAANGKELLTLMGHTGPVKACSLSPDGAWIVSAGEDHTLRVWRLEDGRLVLTLPMLAPLTCVAFHAWQPLVLCGDKGGSLYLLSLECLTYGPLLVTAAGREQGLELRCPACAQNQLVESQTLGGEIDCANPTCAVRLRLNSFEIADPSPLFESGITSDSGSTPAVLSEVHSPEEISTRSNRQSVTVLSLTNFGLLVTGHDDGQIGVWDFRDDQPHFFEFAHPAPVSALAANPAGTMAVSGSRDGILHVWDLSQRTHIGAMTFPAHISAVAFGSEGRIAVGLGDGTLRVWELDRPSQGTSIPGSAEVTALALMPGGYLAVGSRDRKISIWDLTTRKLLRRFGDLQTSITVLGASAHEDRIAGGLEAGFMLRWDLGSAGALSVFKGNPSPALAAAVGSQSLILSGGSEGNVRLIALETKKIIFHHEYGESIPSGALAPDGSRGVVCDAHGKIYRFKVR